ncbi:Protein transport protein Sec23A, partial [Cichlidogyrus casuarinus]
MNSMTDYINSVEANDGLRFAWNYWPASKVEVANSVIPISCLYTPLKERYNLPPINYNPVACSQCLGILNPFCQYDIASQSWICCLCKSRNNFPPQYRGMTPEMLPAELMSQYTTLEYTIASNRSMPPIFLYVLDTCIDDNELAHLKQAINNSIELLPPNSLVGFITFGRMISVHELETSKMSKCWVFNGNKNYDCQRVQVLLGMNRSGASFTPQQPAQPRQMGAPPGQGPAPALPNNKFIQPVEKVKPWLRQIMDELSTDPWPVPAGHRPVRACGAALSIAVGLMEASFPNTGARIMLFQAGPCTIGPGMVVDDDLKNAIRSHNDIDKDNTPFMHKAIKHYVALATRAATNLHVVDIYSCSLDQIGIHEEKYLANYTGGHIVLTDSFASSLFQQTFERSFDRTANGSYKMNFAGQMECKTSADLKVSGCIGSCFSSNVKRNNVGDHEIGIGGTSVWRLNGITPSSTYGVYFQLGAEPQMQGGQQGCYIQFITQFQTAEGLRKIRVTTACRPWIEPTQNRATIIMGFDQEAAAVLMTRW